MKYHEKQQRFKCPYEGCCYSCNRSDTLKNHILTHTGEKPYACTFPGCFKKFSQSSNLTAHYKNHQSSKVKYEYIDIEELLSDKYTGTLNINNLNKLNLKYEKKQLEQFQKGTIKDIQLLRNIK